MNKKSKGYKFNVNTTCEVELTEFGESVLLKTEKEYQRFMKDYRTPGYNRETKIWTTMFWDVMYEFGPYMYMGCKENPIKGNDITLKD